MSLLLGIDIGTSGSKAVLVAPDGAVKAEATTEYPMHVPRPGWAEQNPEDWWQATIGSVKQVLAHAGGESVAGIGLSGQMHGLVLLDSAGRVLRPCIMWNDQRTAAQCGEITRRVGNERLLLTTGKPALTGFTAGKILWLREHEPELYARAAHVLLPKDYVRYRLTGAFLSDVSEASGTNLFDVGRRQWSEELLDVLEIPRAWMPDVTESPVVSALVSRDAATETGLSLGTPVVGGAGDQAAQAIGTGIAAAGVVSVTIGTSGVVFAATDEYVFDRSGALHAYCHAAPGRWHLMGVMLAAGGSLRWYRDVLCDTEKARAAAAGRDAYDLLTETASRVPVGSDGLLFLPYLSGERTPHADPDARGVFFGLSLHHTKAHMTRAVLEGVTFGLRDGLELLKALGVDFSRVRVSGGGARSALWRQMMADTFNVEVVEVNATQGAAYGAALLAGVGAGAFGSVDDACTRTVRETGVTRPGAGVVAYGEFYRRYRALYPLLAPEFKELSRVSESSREQDAGHGRD